MLTLSHGREGDQRVHGSERTLGHFPRHEGPIGGARVIVTLILLGIILPTQSWREIFGFEAKR